MTSEPLREIVSGIDTIWQLDTGRIPEKGERFTVRRCVWDTIDGKPFRVIREVEILHEATRG
jgi:hypothetical protein